MWKRILSLVSWILASIVNKNKHLNLLNEQFVIDLSCQQYIVTTSPQFIKKKPKKLIEHGKSDIFAVN